jgi:nicotinamidase-related amidase
MLSMDLQTAIVSIYGKDDAGLLSRVGSLLARARTSGMAVIHVKVGFRPGLPEISSRNILFSALKNSARHRRLFEGAAGEIHSSIGPEGDDIVVTKHRVNAFTGTDLDMILRAKEIDTLILWGIATSGVVLSTALHAADADYRLVVIKDCCVDQDPQTHECILDKILSRRAAVVTASEFLEALNIAPPPA